MASQAYGEAYNQSQKLGNLYLNLLSLDNMAFVYRFQGKLHEAEKVYQSAIKLVIEQSGKHSMFLGGPLIGYASVLYEWNDLDTAFQRVEKGIWGAEQVGRANLLVQG
jgi:ATP/maltotriose-dependent transcriptional regulator MalT